jgi:starch synthase
MDLMIATSSFLPAPGIGAWGTTAGDAAHAALGLSKGLRALGHRVTLVAPFEMETHGTLGLARRLSPLAVTAGGQKRERTIYDARLPSGVEVVLLAGEPPGEATTELERTARLAWFGHAVAALARVRLGAVTPRPGATDAELEAVVAVGEGAAFTPLAIREDAKVLAADGGPSPRLLAGLSRLYLVLDPSTSPSLPRAALASIGVDDALFTPDGIEFYGEASLAKAGALAADRVLTLGDPLRDALLKPGAAHRYDGVFRARGKEVVSVGGGIDQAQYNPATDPHLTARFDPDDLTGKARQKSALMGELQLEPNVDLPLLALVSGSAPPGLAAAITALGRAMRGELHAVIALGAATVTPDVEAALQRLSKTHAGRVSVRLGVSEQQLHRILGGADFLLTIDTQSATATAVRAGLRYGALPIALRTPAAEEAIVDAEASLATGTGFLADSSDSESLFAAIQRAVSAHGTPALRKLRRRAMRVEGGWERSARRLEALLKQLEE